jgi:hypothetical protein
MKNLDKNLLKLKDGDTAFLQGTSDVTKVTYIVCAATEGKQPITNLNYIKDSKAEIILRRETGAFFTHSVDDYMRYWDKWDKKSMADISVSTGGTDEQLVRQEVRINLAVVVAITTIVCVTVAAIILTPISISLAVASVIASGVAGLASYFLLIPYIPYIQKLTQKLTQDNYNALLDDVNNQMNKIKSLNRGEAFELLGKVDALLHNDPNNETLQNYKNQLESLDVVKDTKNNPGFEKLTATMLNAGNTLNKAYNNRWQRQIGLSRERKTLSDEELERKLDQLDKELEFRKSILKDKNNIKLGKFNSISNNNEDISQTDQINNSMDLKESKINDKPNFISNNNEDISQTDQINNSMDLNKDLIDFNSISNNNEDIRQTNLQQHSITDNYFPNNVSLDGPVNKTYHIEDNTKNLKDLKNNEELMLMLKSQANEIKRLQNQLDEIENMMGKEIENYGNKNKMEYVHESRSGGASMSNIRARVKEYLAEKREPKVTSK